MLVFVSSGRTFPYSWVKDFIPETNPFPSLAILRNRSSVLSSGSSRSMFMQSILSASQCNLRLIDATYLTAPFTLYPASSFSNCSIYSRTSLGVPFRSGLLCILHSHYVVIIISCYFIYQTGRYLFRRRMHRCHLQAFHPAVSGNCFIVFLQKLVTRFKWSILHLKNKCPYLFVCEHIIWY